MSEILTPAERDIQNKFNMTLKRGGLAAVEQLIDDLAIEEAATKVLSDTVNQMQSDNENLLDIRPFTDWQEGYEIVAFTDELRSEHITAMSRHSLALTMFYEAKNKAV